MDPINRPKIGIGVMILKNGKVLLGKRIGSHGSGEYSFPGGHLEYMESFNNCAKREVMEECGINIKNIRFQMVANIIEYAPKHYVNVDLLADWESGNPQVLEADKIDSWDWYDLNKLPGPLFKMCSLAIESYKTGNKYFDITVTA